MARDVLSFYAEFSARAPDELSLDLILHGTPNGPLVSVQVCWSAGLPQGERVLQPLRSFGRPTIDQIAAIPYVVLQSSGDGQNRGGVRSYAKSGFLTAITPDVIAAMAGPFENTAASSYAMVIQQSGGAISRRPKNFTAFPNPHAHYWLMIISRWTDAAQDEANLSAVRAAWKSIEPMTDRKSVV